MPVGCIPEKTIRGDFDLVRISRVEGSRCVYATSVLPVQRFRRCRRDALRGNRPKLQLQLSVAAVRFGPVQGYISPNPEPDRRSGSGKSPNPNLNLRERFFRSGSGSHPLRTRTGPKEPLGLSSQTFVNRTRTKVEIEEMQT